MMCVDQLLVSKQARREIRVIESRKSQKQCEKIGWKLFNQELIRTEPGDFHRSHFLEGLN